MRVIPLSEREKLVELGERLGFEYSDKIVLGDNDRERVVRSVFGNVPTGWAAEDWCDSSDVEDFAAHLERLRIANSVRLALGHISEDIGWGVFATRDIEAATPLALYTGEIYMSGDREFHPYRMQVTHAYGVDAERRGNFTRLINHNFPGYNLDIRVIFDPRIGLEVPMIRTAVAIRAREQLFLDYGEVYWEEGMRRMPFQLNQCLSLDLCEVV